VRYDEHARAARGLVGAMVLHNAGIFAVLVYGGIGLGLSDIALWPTF